jgi:hypothetical protein
MSGYPRSLMGRILRTTQAQLDLVEIGLFVVLKGQVISVPASFTKPGEWNKRRKPGRH